MDPGINLRVLGNGPAPQSPLPELAGAAHRARELQRQLASGSRDAAAALRAEFDTLASGWREWFESQPDYLAPLHDGLARGVPGFRSGSGPGLVVEFGSGSGPATAVLADLDGYVVALDISMQMLRLNPTPVPRVQADVTQLPLRDGAVDLIVGVNAVASWPEVRRVLAASGAVLWVSTFGPTTPLYTEPAAVAAEFPDRDSVTALAGHGSWVAVLPLAGGVSLGDRS